jgi:hypothetical protein
MPTCPRCSSSSASEDPVGVDACPSCGATRVWPQLESAGQPSISVVELQTQLQRSVLRYGVLPWTLPMLIEGQQDLRRIYTRSCWTIERRAATLRLLAAMRNQASSLAALPDPSAIDLWANEPEPVRRQTLCVSRCPPCGGSGRMACPVCRGSNRVTCGGCGGRGQLQREDRIVLDGSGSTSTTGVVQRTEQCLQCGATGKVACDSCDNGTVECMQCDGSSFVEAWIELSVQRMRQVRVEADFDVETMHAGVSNSDDFETPAERLPAQPIADTGWQTPDAITSCPEALRVLLDTRTDRVREVRIQQLRAHGVLLNLATRLGRDVVELTGRPPRLVSGPMLALRKRAWLSLGLGLTTIAVGLAAVGHYFGRSPWFAEHGRGGTLVVLAVLAGGLLGVFVLGATLPNSRRSALRWAAPLAGLLLTLAVAVGVWRSSEPDLLTARAAIEHGDLDRAERELEALTELGRDPAGIAEVRHELDAAYGHAADRERMIRLDAVEELEKVAAILRESWYDAALRDEQIEDFSRRARAEIDAAWTESRANALDDLVAALRGLDDPLASQAKTLAKLLGLRTAIGEEQFEAVRRKLDAIAKTDATADERSIVEAQLRDAVAAAARRHYALGLDVERRDADRVASLDRFEALAKLHEKLTGEPPSEVDREHAAVLAKQLAKAIEQASKRKKPRR